MSLPVQVYTTRMCGYCFAAKRLLAKRGIPYEEVDVTADRDARARLVESTGWRTVPQIFIGATSIGGYEELVALDQSGRLAEMLDAAGPVDSPQQG